MKWTKEPKEDGEYVCRHFWADGTQSGHDYLYRLVGGKWVTLVGEPDKRQTPYDEDQRTWYFGPIPPLTTQLAQPISESYHGDMPEMPEQLREKLQEIPPTASGFGEIPNRTDTLNEKEQ